MVQILILCLLICKPVVTRWCVMGKITQNELLIYKKTHISLIFFSTDDIFTEIFHFVINEVEK